MNIIESIEKVNRLIRRGHGHRGHGHRGAHRLFRILEEEGSINSRVLADKLDIRPSSLNEELKALEEKELIIRKRDENDKRSYLIELSEKGKEEIELRKENHRKKEEQVEKILLKEENEMLISLLNKLSEGLTIDKEVK